MFRVCHAFLSVHCSLVVNCWERVSLLALLYVMFSCVFATFPCGVIGQVWYLIVLIPDLCLLNYVNDTCTIIICCGLSSTHKSITIPLQKQLLSRGRFPLHYHWPVCHYAGTHMRNKNSNIPGRSLYVVKVIFHTIRNCS